MLSTEVAVVATSRARSTPTRRSPTCAPPFTPTEEPANRPSRCSTGRSSASSPDWRRTMPGILDGLRVIEGSAYVAAPLGGMTLAQLGADVIRFDQIGGGLDRNRWPVTDDGAEPVLGRPEQGQALDPGRPALGSRQGAADRADLRARRGRGDPADQLPGPGLALLRGAARAPRRPDHGRDHRQPRRQLGRRLHRQPGDRLPLGDRAPQPGGPLQPPAARLGRDHGHPRGGRRARRRAPPHAAPAKGSWSRSRSRTSPSRWSATSARSPRRSSAGASARRRATTSTAPSAATS